MRIRERHKVLAVLFSGYLLCYMDRMVMASAIPFIAKEFHLSPFAMGGVMSAFFVGYAVMQIPGGFLADRFGPRGVLIASILCWSIFTALTGVAASLTALLTIRVLFGLSEGPFPPTASKTIALWFAPQEVGRANGFQLAAVNIGAAMAPLWVAPLILQWGWRAVFYSLLLPGLVLALIVHVVIRQAKVSDAAFSPPATKDGVSRLGQVVSKPALLWCAASLFFVNIVSWGLMNWLPTYLLQARGFTVTQMGLGASLPFLAGAAGYYVSGHISDKYFDHARYMPIVVGLVLGAAMTYCAAMTFSGEWVVVALIFAFLFLFAASAGLFTLPLLLVPKELVGIAFGFVNTVGQVAAFLSPLLVGYLLNVTQSNFTIVFYGFVGLFILGAVLALNIRQPAPRVASETSS